MLAGIMAKTALSPSLSWAHIVRHHKQVVLVSVAIYDLIVERSLGPKAQALEDANGLGLVRNHFGHNLFQARLLREIEDGLRQYMSQAAMAHGPFHHDTNLAHVPRPSTLALQHRRADDGSVNHGHDNRLTARVDPIEPGFDLLAIEQVLL